MGDTSRARSAQAFVVIEVRAVDESFRCHGAILGTPVHACKSLRGLRGRPGHPRGSASPRDSVVIERSTRAYAVRQIFRRFSINSRSTRELDEATKTVSKT
jgi:hypothetical protein